MQKRMPERAWFNLGSGGGYSQFSKVCDREVGRKYKERSEAQIWKTALYYTKEFRL